MAKHTGKKKRNTRGRKKDKKFIWITAVCTVLAIALVAGMGVLIYKELSGGGGKNSSSTSQQDREEERADELADGEAYDFEAAGYIKLGQYKGLSTDVQPEEEDVFYEMLTAAEGKNVKSRGPVKKGDIVNVDFTARLNGAKLEDASGEDTCIWVGKGEYIEDFEKGIEGIQAGSKKTVDCTFPSDYDDEDLAGKTVQFTIKVNERFGDEAADKTSDGKYKTVKEYYKHEKEAQLEQNRKDKGELVWENVKENAKVKSAPEKMLNQIREDIDRNYETFAELNGMTKEELLTSFGMGEDGVDEVANDTVADIMIAKTIAVKEKLTMDDEYYRKALMESLGVKETDAEAGTLEELEKEYRESQGSRPRDDMLLQRVKDFIGENTTEND